MRFVMLIWRLVVLTFALLCASLAVLVVGLVGIRQFALEEILPSGRIETLQGGVLSLINLAWLALVVFTIIAHAFLPWILAITMTELLRLRHIGWHLAAGAVVAGVAGATAHAVELTQTGSRAVQLLVALGLVGGFVHWLIAGRNAGRWGESITRDTANPIPETSQK